MDVTRRVLAAAICLSWLTGCETTSVGLPDLKSAANDASLSGAPDPVMTGSLRAPLEIADASAPAPPPTPPEPPALTPSEPHDDLSLGKQHFRAGNYGLAERYFRRAAEAGPTSAEAWLGLAASYDRLRRFDLADRAYGELVRILGRTPEVLNNLGYSYMLRGDYKRARETLLAARAKDPANPYIQSNLALLNDSIRTRKAVQ